MTATDTIRAMLDERGVEHYPKRPDVTVWSEGVWHIHAQEDMIEGMLELFVRPVTPEQAIEATLGRGECRMTCWREYIVECRVDFFECSECGWSGAIDDMTTPCKYPRYCPNCGRAVRA